MFFRSHPSLLPHLLWVPGGNVFSHHVGDVADARRKCASTSGSSGQSRCFHVLFETWQSAANHPCFGHCFTSVLSDFIFCRFGDSASCSWNCIQPQRPSKLQPLHPATAWPPAEWVQHTNLCVKDSIKNSGVQDFSHFFLHKLFWFSSESLLQIAPTKLKQTSHSFCLSNTQRNHWI